MTMDLAALLRPCSVKAFYADHYERRFLHVRRCLAGHYDAILSIADLDALLASPALNPANLDLVRNGEVIPAQRWTKHLDRLPGPFHRLVCPERLIALFNDGATIVVNHAESALPRLAAACRAIEADMGLRVQANLYVTPAGAQGFARHYDTHDIFVLQLKGPKQWRLFESGTELPIDPGPVPQDAPLLAELAMEAGDLLYLPRGTAHDVFATDKATVHANFALKPLHGSDLLAQLAREARAMPFFRRALPPSGEDRADYAEAFAQHLAAFLKQWPVQRLIAAQDAELAAGQLPNQQGALASALALETLSADSTLRRRPRASYHVTRDTGGIVIGWGDARLAIPAIVDPAPLLQDSSFSTAALTGMMTELGRLELVRALVRAGYLDILD